MRYLCVDPGNTHSGIVVLDGEKVSNIEKDIDNHELLSLIRWGRYNRVDSNYVDFMLIEGIESLGMPVGRTVFDTLEWIGRFRERFGYEHTAVVYRREVKLFLCGSMQAKDGNVRRALLDRFPQTGGGKEPAVGTKAQPGPLYGLSSHAISALAVGITYQNKILNKVE